jgi:hypothetical protein
MKLLILTILNKIEDSTFGNEAIKDLVVIVDTVVDAILAAVTVVDGIVDTILVDTAFMQPVVSNLGSKEFNSMTCFPSAANPATLTDINDAGGTPWGSGAWVQLVADVGSTDFVVDSIDIANISGADDFELDIATGQPAAESRIGTMAFNAEGQHRISCTAITTDNDAISARIRSKGANGKTVDVKVNVIPRS